MYSIVNSIQSSGIHSIQYSLFGNRETFWTGFDFPKIDNVEVFGLFFITKLGAVLSASYIILTINNFYYNNSSKLLLSKYILEKEYKIFINKSKCLQKK